MAQLGYTINKEDLPEQEGGDYSPLPEGFYTTQITGAELKDTKSGTGQYIKVEYTVVGDNYQGRKVWGNINIKNDSEKAEEIGRSQLNSLMAAIGLKTLSDTDELVGSDVTIKLKVKPAQGEWGPSNEVKAFKSSGTSALKSESKDSDGGGKPPWAK